MKQKTDIRYEITEKLSEKSNLITNFLLDKLASTCNTEINNYEEFLFFSLRTLYNVNSAILGVICDHIKGDKDTFEGFKKMIFDELEYEKSKESIEIINHQIQ